MRRLAEYTMSGRRQAVIAAVLLGLLPVLNLLSASIVALVALRKGWQEGFLVMLWALLPAGLQWLAGDTTAVVVLLAVVPLACLLRVAQRWSAVVVGAVVLGGVLQLSLSIQTGYVARVTALMEQMLAQGMNFQLPQDGVMTSATAEQMVQLFLSFYGAYHALVMIGVLMVARFYQAKLYNPGGFRVEFQALRLDTRVMLVCLALVVGGLAGVQVLEDWVTLLCLAPILTSLAIVHSLAARQKAGGSWLTLAYLMLIFMAPAMVILGFADSVIDFRKRFSAK